MPVATLDCFRAAPSLPRAARGPETSKYGLLGGSTLMRRATRSLFRNRSVFSTREKGS